MNKKLKSINKLTFNNTNQYMFLISVYNKKLEVNYYGQG